MKLYRVFNGFWADSAVNVIVIAQNEECAKELASAGFKRDSDKRQMECGRGYAESYWTNLSVELLSDDTSKPFVSEIKD